MKLLGLITLIAGFGIALTGSPGIGVIVAIIGLLATWGAEK